MTSTQIGFQGPGYDTRTAEREIQAGDEILDLNGERLKITHAERNARGVLVLICTAPDGRTVSRIGARPGLPQEWSVHFAR